MASWADSDTESDVDDAPPPPKKLDAFGESESESESESEEEDESEVSRFCNRLVVGRSRVLGPEHTASTQESIPTITLPQLIASVLVIIEVLVHRWTPPLPVSLTY